MLSISSKYEALQYLKSLGVGKTEIRFNTSETARFLRTVAYEYNQASGSKSVVVTSGNNPNELVVDVSEELTANLTYKPHFDRAAIKQQIDNVVKTGLKTQIKFVDYSLVSFVRAYSSNLRANLSVSVNDGFIHVEVKPRTVTITEFVQAAFENYTGPVAAPDNISESYLRSVVTRYNTTFRKQYSMMKLDGKTYIGLKHDIKNIKPSFEPSTLTANELLELAVKLMREEGLGGREMRAKLEEHLTENDDLL